jgi:hypothetical protein
MIIRGATPRTRLFEPIKKCPEWIYAFEAEISGSVLSVMANKISLINFPEETRE